MVLNSILTVMVCGVALVLWRWVAIPSGGERQRRRFRPHRRGARDHRPAAPETDDAAPAPAKSSLEWADPAAERLVLDTENALLALLLADRIDRATYRARLLALSRGCEPASGDRR